MKVKDNKKRTLDARQVLLTLPEGITEEQCEAEIPLVKLQASCCPSEGEGLIELQQGHICCNLSQHR
jgi:hypothetical protein